MRPPPGFFPAAAGAAPVPLADARGGSPAGAIARRSILRDTVLRSSNATSTIAAFVLCGLVALVDERFISPVGMFFRLDEQ